MDGRNVSLAERSHGWQRTYLIIDLRSFYASVECADRGLDALTTDLVVADRTRSENTICLAVSPSLKAKGVRNRCRVNEIPEAYECIYAMPRMKRYEEVSAQIYAICLRYVSPEDAWPYSVDEAFLDVTDYLPYYRKREKGGYPDAVALARAIMADIKAETGIPATAGLGPNMFLAKVALDLLAKHEPDGIALLDGRAFRHDVWFHHPITDIWGIGPGIARRLARRGVSDLAGICALGPRVMKAEFGHDGLWLLDHAWGQEPATIHDCRSYVPRARSISNGQVLMRDYDFDEARTALREMAWQSCQDLRGRGLACSTVAVWAGYCGFIGPDGRPGAGGQRKLWRPTASAREIMETILSLWDELVERGALIRRLGLSLSGLVPQREAALTLFDDVEAEEREARVAGAISEARERFGPAAVLTGTSLKPGACAFERDLMIGGHRA